MRKDIELRVDNPELKLEDLPRVLRYRAVKICGTEGVRTYDYTVHGTRTSALARIIGAELKLPSAEIEKLANAALTHDIGKVFMPQEVVLKPTSLTYEEYLQIKEHAKIGAEFLRKNNCSSEVVDAALHHHEKFDGSGYPEGLKGENIMLYTRIISVADAFDAMTSNEQDHIARHKTMREALAEINRNSGTQFDPKVVEALKKALERHGISKS